MRSLLHILCTRKIGPMYNGQETAQNPKDCLAKALQDISDQSTSLVCVTLRASLTLASSVMAPACRGGLDLREAQVLAQLTRSAAGTWVDRRIPRHLPVLQLCAQSSHSTSAGTGVCHGSPREGATHTQWACTVGAAFDPPSRAPGSPQGQGPARRVGAAWQSEPGAGSPRGAAVRRPGSVVCRHLAVIVACKRRVVPVELFSHPVLQQRGDGCMGISWFQLFQSPAVGRNLGP